MPTDASDDASPCRYGHDYQQRQLDREQDEIRRIIQSAQTDTSAPRQRREDNPFIAFRSFVDAQFDTLAEGLRGIPSGLTDLRAKLLERREPSRRELEAWRWTGREGLVGGGAMAVLTREERERAVVDAVTVVERARELNRNVPRERIDALFKLDQETAFFGPKGVVGLIGTAGSTGGGGSFAFDYVSEVYRWLSVDWFKRSTYSPTQLEATYEDKNWRAAFEDLLSVSLGKKMASREQFGMRNMSCAPVSTYKCAGVDWMLSLQCRGILPPQLPSMYSSQPGVQLRDDRVLHKLISKDEHPIESWHDAQAAREFYQLVGEIATPALSQAEEPETELDMYERCVGAPEMSGERDEDWEYTVSHAYPANAMGQQDIAERYLQVFEDVHGKVEEPQFTGDRWEDFMAAVRAADHADRRRDTEAAGRYMDEYYRMHEGLEEQVDGEEVQISVKKPAGKCADDLGQEIQRLLQKEESAEEREEKQSESQWEKLYGSLWPKSDGAKRQERESTPQSVSANIYRGKPALAVGWERHQAPDGRIYYTEHAPSAENTKKKPGALPQGWEQRGTPGGIPYPTNHKSRTATFTDPRAELLRANDDKGAQSEPQPPGILGSLTTTQRTLRPDGSVTVYVVLSRVFADGREEVTESVESRQEGWEAVVEARRAEMTESVETRQEGKEAVVEGREGARRPGGWFWS